MADQIGASSTNSLLIIIPSRGDVDWDQDIKNLCFEPISSHDHTGNGNGHTIGTGALEDGAVTHPKLGDASVKEDKIFTGAVTSSKIATGAITSDKLATGSVTNLKIGDAQVDQPKLDAALNILINKIDPMRADLTAAETQIIFDGINIASNTTNIATNAASIVSNDSDIAANAVNIATNDTDIATNASNIASNDTDIATNASNIFGNSSNISTNSAAIANLELSDLTNVSSTSPTSGQVLKWGGSEWGPGTDASAAAGTVIIATQTDANAYTNTAGDTLNITGAGISFSQALDSIRVVVSVAGAITFTNDVKNCSIQSRDTVTFDNPATSGDVDVTDNEVFCKYLKFSCTGNTVGADLVLIDNRFNASVNIEFVSTFIEGTTSLSDVTRSHFITHDIYNRSNEIYLVDSVVKCSKIYGQWRTNPGGSMIESLEGLFNEPSSTPVIKQQEVIMLSEEYPEPFTARGGSAGSFNTTVWVQAHLSGDQSCTTGLNKVDFQAVRDYQDCFSVNATFDTRVTGAYRVSLNLYGTQLDTSGYSQSMSCYIYVGSNGSSSDTNVRRIYGASVTLTGTGRSLHSTDILYLSAGDKVSFYVSGDASWTLQGDIDPDYTTLNIEKIN